MVDFRTEVLERSRHVPVVVDFWAPWCAPCRALGPVIESLADGDAGRWTLVKLNTDEQPEIAQQYGIQGIPAVKMFVDGQVRAEFVGALSQAEVRRWLDEHLPDERTDRLQEIVSRWAEEGAGVAEELERFVEQNPDRAEARLRLAQAIAGSDPARARELAQLDTQDADLDELAGHLQNLIELAQLAGDDLPERLAEPLGAAVRSFREHELDEVLEHLVRAASIDRNFGDQLARRAAVALFYLLGQDHESTREYRRRLAATLHS